MAYDDERVTKMGYVNGRMRMKVGRKTPGIERFSDPTGRTTELSWI
jgi:hypothetical protein